MLICSASGFAAITGLSYSLPSMCCFAHFTVEQGNARTVKRARLVWTPQLHKRFEEAVEKLGHEKAVPKNIMQVRLEPTLTKFCAMHTRPSRDTSVLWYAMDVPIVLPCRPS